MKYQIWEDYVPGSEFASVRDHLGLYDQQIDDIRWGIKLESIPKEVLITSLWPGKIPDVISSGWGGNFVSSAIKNILERFCQPDEVQFIPTKILHHPELQGEMYWLLNVIISIPCFDWDRSQYRTFDGSPDVI